MAGHGHSEPGMIWTVLKWMFILMILGLFILWLITGGIQNSIRTAQTLINPVSILSNATSTGSIIQLPWHEVGAVRGPDISGYADEADQQSAQSERANPAPSTFGNPSPYASKISITSYAVTETDPSSEYVRISTPGISAPVTITGWSLQSAVSGLRAYIPSGTPLFVQGAVNTARVITLQPGDSAIITTGSSPVGISFRENMCTGYLGQNQTFHPALDQSCPDPSQTTGSAPASVRNDGACMDFIQNIPQCTFPMQAPSSLSQTCRTYVGSTFTYSGCVHLYANDPSFASTQWRVYLGIRAELWNNTHDIIRLLDAQGRVVDVLNY